MSFAMMIVIIGCLGILVGAILAAVLARQLPRTVRLIPALALIPISLFSAFGFLAAREPGPSHLSWQVFYALLFFACLTAIARLVLTKASSRDAH